MYAQLSTVSLDLVLLLTAFPLLLIFAVLRVVYAIILGHSYNLIVAELGGDFLSA